MLKSCVWCGREFEAPTRRAMFCSNACRQAHHRAKKEGVRSPEASRLRMSDEEIAAAVLQARGAAAMFDAASVRGPVEKRPLCRLLADAIDGALREVGL